jgi:hypothetical protein
LLLALSGWSQALWMWENTAPQGTAPYLLLLWTGVGVAGLALPVYWLARRWWPLGWMTAAAWVGIPRVSEMGTGNEWLHTVSPLLALLLLGLGLSGVMMGVSWTLGRRWPGPTPNVRPLRVGFWCGLFAVICGWLLINRAFTYLSVALLAGALVLIEAYFVVRETAS